MIRRVPFGLKLSMSEHKRLINLKPWKGKWKDASIVDIKAKIRKQLEDNQYTCAYCGLPFKGKKDRQIEHIAPKASYRQPQFTFTLHNLVLSCIYCNNLMVKGDKMTVADPVPQRYKRCTFLLVHPYFDDPEDHYNWTDAGDKVLIQEKNGSTKGRFSISMFSLDSPEMSLQRAAFSALETLKKAKPISQVDEELVVATMNYKP